MCSCSAREKQELLRRIKAAGCPIEVDVPIVEARGEVTIRQTGDARLIDLGDRGTGVVLWVRFVRENPGQITIVEFGDVFAPWGELSTIWLDPLEDSPRPSYRLSNGFDFPRDSVLNDRLGDRGLCLRQGRLVEGYVLGSTKMPIPARYLHDCVLDVDFSVLDVAGREFRGQVRFAVDRSAPTLSRRPVRSGDGLYAPDKRPQPEVDSPEGTSVGDAESSALSGMARRERIR
jgi:hypothetical protein